MLTRHGPGGLLTARIRQGQLLLARMVQITPLSRTTVSRAWPVAVCIASNGEQRLPRVPHRASSSSQAHTGLLVDYIKRPEGVSPCESRW